MNITYYSNGLITDLPDDIPKMIINLKNGKQIIIIENSTGVNVDWGDIHT